MTQGVQNSNWCCWPFSLCCGEIDSHSEREPLFKETTNYDSTGSEKRATTPGSTPTKDPTVREQRMQGEIDYV